MKESTVDRRIRKTKQQLRQSLTALLKEKPIQDITVRELADLADINRGTFYLHYRDVYDLLNQIEEELLGENQFSIDNPVDTGSAGVYEVTYTATAEDGQTSSVRLIVCVNE